MSKLNIRPWRDQNELLEVRALFYPPDEVDTKDKVQQRRLAVNITNIWKRRTRLPHTIYSTAFLTDAILVHEEFINSQDQVSTIALTALTIRSLYATAVARFVTGLCDTAQNAAVKRSMYEMAAELGIPERWVELRHEITHGQIPELRALEECAREGIEWLWEVFWGRLDTVHSHGDAAQKRQEMSELFKSFFKEKKIDIRRGQSTNMSLITRTTKMILQLAKNEEDMQTVADILVEEKLILPNQKSLDVNMKAAYLIWDKLLQDLVDRRHNLYIAIVTRLQAELDSPTQIDPTSDPEKDAIFQWLSHLFTSKKWIHTKGGRSSHESLSAEVMENCLMSPNTWSKKLGKVLLDHSNDVFRQNWTAIYNASFDESLSEEHDQEMESSDYIALDEEDDEAISDQDLGMTDYITGTGIKAENVDLDVHPERRNGWKLLDGPWIPRPIGV